ncbi:MAG: PAS domain-containing protein, partial [Verrucomicrobiales bacterium]
MTALLVIQGRSLREQITGWLEEEGIFVEAAPSVETAEEAFSGNGLIVAEIKQGGDPALGEMLAKMRASAVGAGQPHLLVITYEAGDAPSVADGTLRYPVARADFQACLEEAEQRRIWRMAAAGQQVARAEEAKARIAARGGDLGGGGVRLASADPARPASDAAASAGSAFAIMGEAAPLALALFDTEMRYLAANRLWRSSFGLEGTEVLGRCHYDLFPDLHDGWRGVYSRALAGESQRCERDKICLADGTEAWMRWEAAPWHLSDGSIGGILSSSEIVPPPERTDPLGGALLDSRAVAALWVDLEGKIVAAGKAASALFGTGLPGKSFADLAADEDTGAQFRAEFTSLYEAAADGRDVPARPPETAPMRSAEGRAVTVEWWTAPIRNASGGLSGSLKLGRERPAGAGASRSGAEPWNRFADAHPALLWRCGADGSATFVNTAWQKFFGRGLAEEQGDGWLDGVAEPDRRRVRQAVIDAAAAQRGIDLEFALAEKAGGSPAKRAALSAKPSFGESGEFAGLSGYLRELPAAAAEPTRIVLPPAPVDAGGSGENLAAVKADGGLADSGRAPGPAAGEPASVAADLHREICEMAPFGVAVIDERGRAAYVNPRFNAVLDRVLENGAEVERWLRAASPDPTYAEETVARWRDSVWRRQITRVVLLRHRDGRLRDIELRPSLLGDGRLMVAAFDVTEAQRSEERLRQSEAKFRAFFRGCGVPMALAGPDGDIQDANPALERLLGLPIIEIQRRPIDDLLAGDSAAKRDALIRRLMEGGGRFGEEDVALAGAAESPLPVRLSLSLLRNPSGSLSLAAYLFQPRDAAPGPGMADELRESQGQNRALLDAVPDLVLLVDRTGSVLDLMPSAEFPGIAYSDSLLGRSAAEILPAASGFLLSLVAEAERLGRSAERTAPVALAEGEEPCLFRLSPAGGGQFVLLVRRLGSRLGGDAGSAPLVAGDVFDAAPDGFVLADADGTVRRLSPAAADLLGIAATAAVGAPLDQALPGALGGQCAAAAGSLAAGQSGGRVARGSGRLTVRGRDRVIEFAACTAGALPSDAAGSAGSEADPGDAAPAPRPVLIQLRDATDEAERESRLENSLRRHRILLQEIHHRVKNNLQVASSLLNMQRAAAAGDAERDALFAGQLRLQSIAYAHEQLNAAQEASEIDFAAYVGALAAHICRA